MKVISKVVIIGLIGLILYFGGRPVIGAPMVPLPECSVRAEIVAQGVEYNPYTDWAPEQGIGKGKTGDWTVIEILKAEEEPVVATEFAPEDYCPDFYQQGKKITLRLEEDYGEGSVIEGGIKMSGDEFAVGYRMSDVKVVEVKQPAAQSGPYRRYIIITGIIVLTSAAVVSFKFWFS